MNEERRLFVKFDLGRIVATPGASEALAGIELEAPAILRRHASGDWGDLDEEDKATNDRHVKHNGRLLSAYTLSTGVRVWVITEADRSATTILLPDEY